MDVDRELVIWSVVWLIAAFILLVRHWRVGAGAGLLFTYVLSFGVLQWFAPVLHLLPWFDAQWREVTAIGLKVAAIAMVAFAVGAEVSSAIWYRRHSAHESEPHSSLIDRRQAVVYIVVGIVMFSVVSPITWSIPSLGALVSTGSTLVVAGVVANCWNAWSRQDRPGVWRWLLAAGVFPLVTVVTQGFLGYGFAAMIVIVCFVASIYRPRQVVVVAGVILAYLGLSVYVTYMRDRVEIRGAVWSGAEYQERFQVVRRAFEEFEWFDLWNEDHLHRVDHRLNQSYLVGTAVEYIGDGDASFARGRTFTDALLAVVPRALWPGKPITAGSGTLVTEFTGIRFAENTSVGIGQVLECYVNFGYPGVVFGFFLIGVLMVIIDGSAVIALREGDIQRFLRWYLPGLSLLQIGGSFVEATSSAAAALLVALVLGRFLRERRAEVEPATAPVASGTGGR